MGRLGVTDVSLTDDDLAAVTTLPAECPGWMIAMQGANRG